LWELLWWSPQYAQGSASDNCGHHWAKNKRNCYPSAVDAEEILLAINNELRKHTWDTFVDHPPSMAKGGKGVVVPGCPACRKRVNTFGQFMDHICTDVLPKVIEAVINGRDMSKISLRLE
jgi:hypothetical protein